MEFLIEYGLFFAKSVTILVATLALIAFLFSMTQRHRGGELAHIEVKSLNESLTAITRNLKAAVLPPEAFKAEEKQSRRQAKEDRKSRKKESGSKESGSKESGSKESGSRESGSKEETAVPRKSRIFVIDFEGDLQASNVRALREEITAILSMATEEDEVLVRLESSGGVVHGYGLAASQLQRIRTKGVPLTVSVDKVAASGGYMMACNADKIIAAPFAILGSIGVVAQIPNFHRFLQDKDIDVEVLTAGEYKRTLTVFGENTKAGREKFVSELEDVHLLFKELVSENRPMVDMETVGTGAVWYGRRALDHHLIDEVLTSDEYIVDRCGEGDVFLVRYVLHKSKLDQLMEKFTGIFRPSWLEKPPSASPHLWNQ